MMKVTFLILLISLFIVSGCTKKENVNGRPNILFIMSDDHAIKAISAYDNSLIQTPNIDRLASKGALFTNAFVTNSICGPSRATMLTGMYSHRNGFKDNLDEFNGDQNSWIKELRAAGYSTSVIGKWHLKSEPQGFDFWSVLIDQGEYYNPRLVEMGDTSQHIGYTTELITEMALKQLQKRDKDKPFAMLVHHKAPHRNWMPAPQHIGAFEDEVFPLPKTFFDNYEGRNAAEEADMKIENMFLSIDMKLLPAAYEAETGSGGSPDGNAGMESEFRDHLNRLTPEQRKTWDAHYDKITAEYKELNPQGKEKAQWMFQRYLRDYMSTILSVDESVGQLLDYLDESGLARNTIVVYTSDQGFYLGEHGWYDKRFMYKESHGMPLIMSYPKEIKGGQKIDDFVLNLDFAPTFLNYAGVKIPENMQGEPIGTLFEDVTAKDWRKSVYYHYYEYPYGWHSVNRHYGIRREDLKLIHFYQKDQWELFDLKKDPDELINLIDNPDYQDIKSNLKEELYQLKQGYGDMSDQSDSKLTNVFKIADFSISKWIIALIILPHA